MRIAIYHNLPSGGAKRTLYEAARRLAEKHPIDVFSTSSANHEFGDLRPLAGRHEVEEFQPLPLFSSPFGRLNQVMRLADLFRIRAVQKRIAQKIDQGGYDVLLVEHCRFEKSPSILRYVRRVPSVYFCQEPLRELYEPMPPRPYIREDLGRRRVLNRIDPLPGLYFRSLRQADRENARSAGRVLVNSEFMRQAVDRIYSVRSQVCYHAVDHELFRPLPLQKKNYVLSVGSLTPLKGFDFLIRSLAHVPAGLRPCLIIASNFENPPEREYLLELARESGVKLQLAGNVDDQSLVELYNQASLTLYAPVREPFGLVPLEAMACQVPVVAVSEGGIRETVLHQVTGLLVEREPEQFAAAVTSLLSDPALACRLGENGRKQVLEQWTWDLATARLENHLAETASI